MHYIINREEYMKWEEHLKGERDKGFEDGKNYSNQVNIAATTMASIILIALRRIKWKKARQKFCRLFK